MTAHALARLADRVPEAPMIVDATEDDAAKDAMAESMTDAVWAMEMLCWCVKAVLVGLGAIWAGQLITQFLLGLL